jgi:hypothetical protein
MVSSYTIDPSKVKSGVYQAGQIKRRRRTADQVGTLERQILGVLLGDHPQSIRHVFYRMTDPRLEEPVNKDDHGYQQVQHRITQLRRDGRLPYGWITDATRRGYHTDTFDDAEDFLIRVNGLYRADLWALSDYYCEVWCESRSIAGIIEDDCEELAVSLYPAGGFSSITLAYEAAEFINAKQRRSGKPCIIYYIGDYDPAGVLIDKQIEKELREHLSDDVDLEFDRIAITAEQIQRYSLPGKPRKATDRRVLHLKETVEAEAMPAGIMRVLLREKIESLLPDDALAVTKEAEESERHRLINQVKFEDDEDEESAS